MYCSNVIDRMTIVGLPASSAVKLRKEPLFTRKAQEENAIRVAVKVQNTPTEE
jgi:hypothetical protein